VHLLLNEQYIDSSSQFERLIS